MNLPIPPRPDLLAHISREMEQGVSPGALALTETIIARHGASVAGVLFYGSCLRDGIDDGRVLDLYVLVDSYTATHGFGLSAAANFLLPPNVYYLEVDLGGKTVRAKYAMVTTQAFERRTRRGAFHPYFWARFAQPAAAVYARDRSARERMVAALARAFETMIGETAPLLPPGATARDLWCRAFSETYRCELRAERESRAAALFDAYAERYSSLTVLPGADQRGSPSAARLTWGARRAAGKLLSVLRLVKSSFTFTGGADYILWKIGQHAGVELKVTPWQKRHPIMASPVLLWRGLRRGAFR